MVRLFFWPPSMVYISLHNVHSNTVQLGIYYRCWGWRISMAHFTSTYSWTKTLQTKWSPNNGKVELILCLYQHTKRSPRNNEVNSNVKRPLWEQSKVFGTRRKIMWEWQVVDPLIHFINQQTLNLVTNLLY